MIDRAETFPSTIKERRGDERRRGVFMPFGAFSVHRKEISTAQRVPFVPGGRKNRRFLYANRLIEALFFHESRKKRKESAFAGKGKDFFAKKRRNDVCRTGRFLLAEREKERPSDGFCLRRKPFSVRGIRFFAQSDEKERENKKNVNFFILFVGDEVN